MIVTPCIPHYFLSAANSANCLILSFFQPALVHHQMILGLHIHKIFSLCAALYNQWERFSAYQQWVYYLFSLLSNNQRDYITSQDQLTKSIEHLCSSVPGYACEHLQEFNHLQQPWKAQVEPALNIHCTNSKQLMVALCKIQVAALQQEILELLAVITESTGFPGPSEDKGCCPGIPEQLCIYCARELIALANRPDHMKQDPYALDIDFQEMSKLIESVN
ncbi:hypothetical protein DSO57_1018391 [Entomophthora muscae]|uniref:Uncharacterized protein n=1 Tax=Entomophthora muscae TaxID=34485 RepID=A0ACC2U2F3_9FUNG|nr:hypothetical protein DSO57_1018391 [Entomophthora muscae]